MKVAVYPGSFDPITLGHIDIIERAQARFDKFIVLISNSENKQYLFSPEERKHWVQDCLKHLPHVEVEVFSGLTVDFAKLKNASVIIRGIRAVSDFEYEMAMANMNRHLNSQIETFIVFSRPEVSYISSRMIKEVAMNGGKLEGLVSSEVQKALGKKVKDI